eukprot:5049013-Prymnesium_polylepis.1
MCIRDSRWCDGGPLPTHTGGRGAVAPRCMYLLRGGGGVTAAAARGPDKTLLAGQSLGAFR